MKSLDKKILMIFIEPTPYILDLLEKGFENIHKKCDVVFLYQNVTQSWDLQSRAAKYLVCPSQKQIFKLYKDVFFKKKYSLVHLAGWNNPYILFFILASRLFLYPVTVESDTSFNSNHSTWKKVIKKCLYPILFQFPDYFLPGGTRQKKYLQHYGVSSKKIMQAQMTVDIESIQSHVQKIVASDREKLRAQHNASWDDVVFLFVARLLDWKGVRELIEAFKLIDSENTKLWIVGFGDLADEVKIASQKNTKINYFGRVSGGKLWNVYNAADVFLIPSHHEPWGLVVNEAMAAGLPVIATEGVGCVDDLISHNKQGLIVPPKNIMALSEAMRFMINHAEKREQMSQDALNTIQSWTVKNEADNMIAAWELVMTRKSQRVYS